MQTDNFNLPGKSDSKAKVLGRLGLFLWVEILTSVVTLLAFSLIHSMDDALMDTKTQTDILLGTKTGLPFCYGEDDVTLLYCIFQGSREDF